MKIKFVSVVLFVVLSGISAIKAAECAQPRDALTQAIQAKYAIVN